MIADDLIRAGPIERWDEAIPLGNGLLGVLLWKGEDALQLSIDRSDLWDVRKPPLFKGRQWNWKRLHALIRKKQWDALEREFKGSGTVCPYPTKLPAGRLILQFAKICKKGRFRLNRRTATGYFHGSGRKVEIFCEADTEIVYVRYQGNPISWKIETPPYSRRKENDDDRLNPHQELTALGYASETWWENKGQKGFVQPLHSPHAYALGVQEFEERGWTVLALTVKKGENFEAAKKAIQKRLRLARKAGWEKSWKTHALQWEKFWNRSCVCVPDREIADHYRTAKYLLNSASREKGPPVSLQGVWTADDGKLPPWKGDYHHDLNTQLTYWPHLTLGSPALMRGFLNFMFDLVPVHTDLARKFFKIKEGIFVPGAMAYDGQLIGGYVQVSYGLTNGAWIAQLFYRYWQYTRDEDYLKQRVYPYCSGVGKFLRSFLRRNSDGVLALPVSSSPEIHEGGPEGWLVPNSNYDLALMRHLFSALSAMAPLVGDTSTIWDKTLAQLPPLSTGTQTNKKTPKGDRGPFLIAPGKPLPESHRHHSHLMAIYPLGLVSVDDDETVQQTIEESFRQIDKLGTGHWVGYSFTWMGCLAARTHRAERALRMLKTFVPYFVSPNGFHLNEDFRKAGVSSWNHRVFTLEGNFSFLEAVHEMLFQSWRGIVRIFPAVPKEWTEVSFQNLMGEGGIMVSAKRKKGVATELEITAQTDGEVCILDPFLGQGRWSKPPSISHQYVKFFLKSGESVTGFSAMNDPGRSKNKRSQ